MKKKVLRIFAVVMMLCVSFLCVGCAFIRVPDGDDGDFDFGDESNWGGSSSTNNLYGTKVLYRPDSYDYNAGSGAEEGQVNNYYGQYAYSIIRGLYNLYAIPVNDAIENYLDNDSSLISVKESGNYKYSNYLYDSIRYQVNSVGKVTHSRKQNETETIPIEEKNTQNKFPYTIVTADTGSKWKWTFDYDYIYNNTNPVTNISAPITHTLSTSSNKDLVYISTPRDMDLTETEKNDSINRQFTSVYNNITSTYFSKYIGASTPTNEENYTNLIKALEYVIYSYALDLEPQTIIVNPVIQSDENPYPYSVSIGAYRDAQTALDDIKALFNRIGSFVGLTNRQIAKIANWIKTNVIGINDTVRNDTFRDFSTGGIIEIVDENDNIIGFDFTQPKTDTITNDLGRSYSETVDAIVKNVCKDVPIGEESDGSKVPVDDRFLASEIMEYSKNLFMVADDDNFPVGSSATDEGALRPLEYQSAVIMLNKPMGIMQVDVALKYDADLDGTEEGVYNMDKYIDVIVELNYYNHDANKMFVVDSKKMRVYDGPYAMTFDDLDYDLPDFHGTAQLVASNIAAEGKDLLVEAGAAGEVLPVKAFNPNVGDGILKTDVGQNGYGDNPRVSQNPLILVGTTDVRKYYQIVEPTDAELGSDADTLTYITGRLNPTKFAGSDGCDYLEITYKVLKEKGNTTKNYKFYTGITAIWDADI